MADGLEAPNRRVFDMGCGGGQWANLLVRRGWNAICADSDERDLSLCQLRLPEARCILMPKDYETLPVKSREVGLVLCIEVFQVLNKGWFEPEASRILADGGHLVGVFPNRASIRGWIKHYLDSRDDVDWYSHSYTDWKRSFCKLGFTMIHEEGFCWFPFHRDSNSRLVPICTTLERRLGLDRLISFSPWIIFIAKRIGASKSV
jgi:SAM-dependent methyltransferase